MEMFGWMLLIQSSWITSAQQIQVQIQILCVSHFSSCRPPAGKAHIGSVMCRHGHAGPSVQCWSNRIIHGRGDSQPHRLGAEAADMGLIMSVAKWSLHAGPSVQCWSNRIIHGRGDSQPHRLGAEAADMGLIMSVAKWSRTCWDRTLMWRKRCDARARTQPSQCPRLARQYPGYIIHVTVQPTALRSDAAAMFVG